MTKIQEIRLFSVINESTVVNYIFDCIDSEPYDITTNTEIEKLHFLAQTFSKEYLFSQNLQRYGNRENVFSEWIMGLPSVFNVDFENYRIIEILTEWNVLNENSSDEIIDVCLAYWFKYIAKKTFQLFYKNGIIPEIIG